MSKPYREIWHELQGTSVLLLNIEEKHDYQSISKTKTFTPPSKDRAFIFSQLSKNIENACIKARRHDLAPKKIFFFIKTQEFRYQGLELTLTSRMSAPHEIIRLVHEAFPKIYNPKVPYRATGIVLMDLSRQEDLQPDLFGLKAGVEAWKPIYAAVDTLDEKFGKHTVYLGSTFQAMNVPTHQEGRNTAPQRSTKLFKGENKRQRLGIPMLGDVK